jgi:hypothetical protein
MCKSEIKQKVMQCQSRESIKENRKILLELYKRTPVPQEELLVNLHMYTRSSVLAKILYINELYELIIKTPGAIMEFGVWWGANMVTFENLRTIYEPYNYTRKIIGFDTFDGYKGISEQDGDSELVVEGNYDVIRNYTQYLTNLMEYHRAENSVPNKKKYEIIEGDATKTVEKYLKLHPETIVALAYFDMQLYAPTKKCLEAILPHLTKGSVIAMDELNNEDFPGETIAFKEVIGTNSYKITRSRYLPDRSYIIID